MTSEDQNFELYAGEEKEPFTITVRDGAGALVDLTGATITWIVKRTEDDAAGLITKAVGSGITLSNQTTHKGEFTITLESEDTADLGGASYYHEARVTDIAHHPTTITRGIMTIRKTLT